MRAYRVPKSWGLRSLSSSAIWCIYLYYSDEKFCFYHESERCFICIVSSSDMTSLHSVPNFFLPSLIEFTEWGKLHSKVVEIINEIKIKVKWINLHWLNCKAVALVGVHTKAIDHILKLRLRFLPCLPVDLLMLGLLLSCWLRFLAYIIGIWAGHYRWILSWALHGWVFVASEGLSWLLYGLLCSPYLLLLLNFSFTFFLFASNPILLFERFSLFFSL